MRSTLRPAPGQQAIVDRILAATRQARTTGCGRTLFVAGAEGAGRSQALIMARDALADERVALRRPDVPPRPGSAVVPVFDSPNHAQDAAEAATSLVQRLAGKPVAVIRDSLLLGVALVRLFGEHRDVGLDDVLADTLRAAARERSMQPLVCLIDDADQLGGGWWSELHFWLAGEIARDLPLVLVLAVDGPSTLSGKGRPGESHACSIARDLVADDLADWIPCARMDAEALAHWHGPIGPAVIDRTLGITDGRIGDVARLWEDWLDRGALVDDGRRVVEGPHFELTLETAPARLARRVDVMTTGSGERARARDVLAAGALEGRAFTVDAVAAALSVEPDAVAGVVSGLGGGDAPVLELLGDSGRVRFVASLDWRAARMLLDGRRAKLTGESMADALIGLHADRPHAYAHVIAPMLRRAGRGEAAAHFEKLCGIASSQTLLRSQAHRLIAEGAPRPDPNEERAAVELLEAAVWALVDVDSFVETLTIAEHARGRAEHLDPPSPSLLATLLGFEARLHAGLGRADESAAAFDAAERAAATGPRDLLGRILVMRVTTEGDTHATDTDQIRRTLDRAERVLASLGRRDGVGICMYCRSKLAVIEGRTEAARELAENARRLVPHGSDMYWAATMAAGETTFALGRRREGRALLEQALAGLREFDKQGGVAATLRILARADVTEGDLERARQHAMAAQEIFTKTMDRYGEAGLTRTLAEIAWAEGRADAAIATLERACRMHETLGNGRQVQECNDLRQQYEKQRTGGLGKPPDLVERED